MLAQTLSHPFPLFPNDTIVAEHETLSSIHNVQPMLSNETLSK
jgi:hypothetical protein